MHILKPRASGPLTIGSLAVVLSFTAAAAENDPAGVADPLSTVVVRAERRDLIGTTSTASEGIVVNDELALTPAYRPGQLLETPGPASHLTQW